MAELINEFRGAFFFLSNFYASVVTFDGVSYDNSEAAFQAMKTLDLSVRLKFANMQPGEAKKAGGRRGIIKLRSDWETVKDDLMYEIVKAKFLQNGDLKAALLATGDAELEEGNTWGDDYWGTVNGVGKNKLGKILMRIRSELTLAALLNVLPKM